MSKKEKRNYIKLGLLLLVVVIVTFAVSNLYKSYNKSKAQSGYISKYVSNIEYKELANTITELNSNTFVYLTYTGSEDVYNLEKNIRKVLKKNDYEDNLIYVDCTLNLNNNYSVKGLNNILSVGNKDIILPAIVYFKDNNPLDYVDSSSGLLDVSDFVQLLDKYELEGNK